MNYWHYCMYTIGIMLCPSALEEGPEDRAEGGFYESKRPILSDMSKNGHKGNNSDQFDNISILKDLSIHMDLTNKSPKEQ